MLLGDPRVARAAHGLLQGELLRHVGGLPSAVATSRIISARQGEYEKLYECMSRQMLGADKLGAVSTYMRLGAVSVPSHAHGPWLAAAPSRRSGQYHGHAQTTASRRSDSLLGEVRVLTVTVIVWL